MKKVLLGLLALSAAAMAAAPNLGATPTAETNVFKTGQTGATFNPTALLAKATLDGILSNLRVVDNSKFGSVIISNDGSLYANNGNDSYFGPLDSTKFLALSSANKGEAEFVYAPFSLKLWKVEEWVNPVLAQFAGGHPMGNAKILVKVQ